MAEIATYSPEDVSIIIAGVTGIISVDGFSEDSFIDISKTNPTYTARESMDGVVARLRRNSDLFNVSLSLAATSETNQLLTYLHRVDELTQAGKFVMTIKDNSGQSLFFASQCWIDTLPDFSLSTGITERVWEISAYGGVMNVGGNYSNNDVIDDVFNIGTGLLSRIL